MAIKLFENQLFPLALEANSGLIVLIREQNFCQTLMDVPPDFENGIKNKSSKSNQLGATFQMSLWAGQA